MSSRPLPYRQLRLMRIQRRVSKYAWRLRSSSNRVSSRRSWEGRTILPGTAMRPRTEFSRTRPCCLWRCRAMVTYRRTWRVYFIRYRYGKWRRKLKHFRAFSWVYIGVVKLRNFYSHTTVTPSRKNPSRMSHANCLKDKDVGISWQLRGLRGLYGVYVTPFRENRLTWTLCLNPHMTFIPLWHYIPSPIKVVHLKWWHPHNKIMWNISLVIAFLNIQNYSDL